MPERWWVEQELSKAMKQGKHPGEDVFDKKSFRDLREHAGFEDDLAA